MLKKKLLLKIFFSFMYANFVMNLENIIFKNMVAFKEYC